MGNLDNLDNLDNILENLATFDAGQELRNIVEENGNEIVLLQKQQLADAIGKDGVNRVDRYSPGYARLKVRKYIGLGAAVDRVTFYADGGLYDMLKLILEGDTFYAGVDFIGFEGMVDRIGDSNYGLNTENCEKFANEFVVPGIQEVFTRKIFNQW